MGGKKKSKKGKKGSKKAKASTEEGEKPMNPIFKNSLPSHGWIRVELRLCDPPVPEYNFFIGLMRSNQGVREIM